MNELAAYERVRTPTTMVAIRRLVKLGLVDRSADHSDLPAVLVNITPEGHQVHRESLASRRLSLAAMLNDLSPKDFAALERALSPMERSTMCGHPAPEAAEPLPLQVRSQRSSKMPRIGFGPPP